MSLKPNAAFPLFVAKSMQSSAFNKLLATSSVCSPFRARLGEAFVLRTHSPTSEQIYYTCDCSVDEFSTISALSHLS